MALKLEDLGINSRDVLRALADQPANRRRLADKTGLSVTQISRALNRLSVFGLINHPVAAGDGWSLNAVGYALLGVTAPEPVSPVAEPDDEPPESPAAEAEAADTDAVAPAAAIAAIAADPYSPATPGDTDRIAADLLAAMEIEVALDHVRSKLRSAAIPARAQRVYREVLNVLPPTQ